MTLLLTGGSGFLGKKLSCALRESNIDFVAPSSLELDLTSLSSTINYFDKIRPNKIIHAAAFVGGLGLNKKQPADLTHINLKMAVNIFDAVRKYSVEYFYGIGTICSYPEHCQIPFKESDFWLGFSEPTNSGYGLAKKMLFMLQSEHRKQYGLKGAHLVPVNMMGPGDSFDESKSHVIPALIRKFVYARANNKPEVYCFGTGNASREFLYVEDCAKAIVKAVTTELDYDGPINIGTGKSIFIRDLATLIAELTNYSGKIVFTGEVGDGQPLRQLDVSLIKELLGWEAETDLRDGLVKTIAWYRENYK